MDRNTKSVTFISDHWGSRIRVHALFKYFCFFCLHLFGAFFTLRSNTCLTFVRKVVFTFRYSKFEIRNSNFLFLNSFLSSTKRFYISLHHFTFVCETFNLCFVFFSYKKNLTIFVCLFVFLFCNSDTLIRRATISDTSTWIMDASDSIHSRHIHHHSCPLFCAWPLSTFIIGSDYFFSNFNFANLASPFGNPNPSTCHFRFFASYVLQLVSIVIFCILNCPTVFPSLWLEMLDSHLLFGLARPNAFAPNLSALNQHPFLSFLHSIRFAISLLSSFSKGSHVITIRDAYLA